MIEGQKSSGLNLRALNEGVEGQIQPKEGVLSFIEDQQRTYLDSGSY